MTPDSFLLICDGASGDVGAEVRMASYLVEMFTGWKRAHRTAHAEPWSVESTRGGTWGWTPDGRLCIREPKNRAEDTPP